MAMLAGRAEHVQFTDSMRSIESLVKQRLDYVRNGVVTTPGSCRWTGSQYDFSSSDPDGSCIVIGQIFEFSNSNPDEIDIYPMYGKRLTTKQLEDCIYQDSPLWCVEPTTHTDDPEAYSISWQTGFSSGDDNSRALGFFRDPASTRIIPIAFNNNFTNYNQTNVYRIGDTRTEIDSEFDSWYCFSSVDGSKHAALRLGSDLESDTVNIIFSDEVCTE